MQGTYPQVTDERLATIKLALHDMTDDERGLCRIGLFPVALLPLHLDNHESAALIGLADTEE